MPHARHILIHRAIRGLAVATLTALIAVGTSFAAQKKPGTGGTVNVLTFHNDQSRSGANTAETTLTPSNVNSNSFGKLWTFTADGTVDAQPLLVSGLNMGNLGTHDVLYIATENDTLYAVDAEASTILWQKSLLLTGEAASDNRGCTQISPKMGITATPVINLISPSQGGVIVAVAMSKDSSGNYHQRVHSLSLTTGAEQTGSPIAIQGSYASKGPQSSGGLISFSPGGYKARAALLLVDNTVYVEFASNCDTPPYSGWIFAYNITSMTQNGIFNVSPNGEDGALWGSGGGPAADSDGNIYMMVGNGTFDTTLSAGFPVNGDYGNSFIRLAWSGGKLQVADYFASFDAGDGPTDERVELGSSAPLLLPTMTDNQGQPHNLLIGSGKLGTIFIVDTANMGKYVATQSNANAYQHVVGSLGPGGDGNDALGAVRTAPVYFNNMVYFGPNLDPIEAFGFQNATMSRLPVTATNSIFNYPGAAMSISANGSNNGILWVASPGSPSTGGGLMAYPAGDLTSLLYSSNQAGNGRDQFTYAKFAPPTVANGMVYVTSGSSVVAFGLLP